MNSLEFDHCWRLNFWIWILSWPTKILITIEELIKHKKQSRQNRKLLFFLSPKLLLQGKEELISKESGTRKEWRFIQGLSVWHWRKAKSQFNPRWVSALTCGAGQVPQSALWVQYDLQEGRDTQWIHYTSIWILKAWGGQVETSFMKRHQCLGTTCFFYSLWIHICPLAIHTGRSKVEFGIQCRDYQVRKLPQAIVITARANLCWFQPCWVSRSIGLPLSFMLILLCYGLWQAGDEKLLGSVTYRIDHITWHYGYRWDLQVGVPKHFSVTR